MPTQDPGSKTEPGAPSVSRYFLETCSGDILSAFLMSTGFKIPIPGHPPDTTGTPRFQKLLVARYSPQNQCFAEEGDNLYAPVSPARRVARNYYFLSAKGNGKRSKFGWVKTAEQPFSVKDFIAEHPEIEGSDEQNLLLANLFSAIANLSEGTPVAGSYFRRGIEQRRDELSFHKVFLYPAKTDEAELDP